MPRLKPNLRTGLYGVATTLLVLLFVPPVIAPYLDEWDAATLQLSKRQDVLSACGTDSAINLSRWFYSFKVSGGHGSAQFDGAVESNGCKKSFTVELEKRDYVWRISKFNWKS